MERYIKREFITKIDANYILIIGQRSNGKSFAVKEDIIKRCLENGEQFAYIRRFKEDCKQYMIEEYFADIICDSKGVNHLEKWSKGKYNTVKVDRQNIYLAYIDEDEKITKGVKLGRCFGLSWATHYKSLSFPEITTGVFEEFITDNAYLSDNEPRLFMQLVSTIFREKSARIYMVGNTVSRVNPYVNEWGLYKGINKQKLGTVDYYKQPYTNDNGETLNVTIAVYLTHTNLFNSGMFFGNVAKSIVGGLWESDEQPHIIGSIDDYNILYSLVFAYDNNVFLMRFLQDRNNSANLFWFVTPKTTDVQKNSRIVSNKYIHSPYATIDFVPLSQKEKIAFNILHEKKVVFPDNLTGSEFFQCYNKF